MAKIWKAGALISIGVFAADQLSKWWIVDKLMATPQAIEVTSFFNVVMVWNRGVSFGFFGAGGDATRWILSALSMAVVVGLCIWMVRAQKMVVGAALGLVIGGAIGNVADRLHYCAVADFLDFHLLGWHWPAFNVADSAIFIGVGLLFLDAFLGDQE